METDRLKIAPAKTEKWKGNFTLKRHHKKKEKKKKRKKKVMECLSKGINILRDRSGLAI